MFCGVCGSVMVTDKRKEKLLYRCNRASAGLVPGHGGLAIDMETTNDVVVRRVWHRLGALDPADEDDREMLAEAARRFAAQTDTSGRDADLAAARAEMEHVRGALRTLYQDRQDGLYEGATGRGMFRESVQRLTAHEERMVKRVASLEESGKVAVRLPTEWLEAGDDPLSEEALWGSWSLQEQREFLALFLERPRWLAS